VVVAAKRDHLNVGLGQGIAEMVAAQKFNAANQQPMTTIYGAITSGTAWRLLKLTEQVVTIDVRDYPFPPVEELLSMLVWMVQSG
jgi:hypothetical protein